MTEDRARPSLEEMGKLAEVICGVVGDGPELERVAVAHVILNRARRAADHYRRVGRRHPHFGDGSIGGACEGLSTSDGLASSSSRPGGAGFAQRGFFRAFATACLALSRDVGDPTGGATAFHRHDGCPDRAGAEIATALIGEHLFYSA